VRRKRNLQKPLRLSQTSVTCRPLSAPREWLATLSLTHREIGETIGASREIVTRLFSQFKREGLIEIQGSSLILTSKAEIERLLEGS
jgi:CRP-like cAMP-binding protein